MKCQFFIFKVIFQIQKSVESVLSIFQLNNIELGEILNTPFFGSVYFLKLCTTFNNSCQLISELKLCLGLDEQTKI